MDRWRRRRISQDGPVAAVKDQDGPVAVAEKQDGPVAAKEDQDEPVDSAPSPCPASPLQSGGRPETDRQDRAGRHANQTR